MEMAEKAIQAKLQQMNRMELGEYGHRMRTNLMNYLGDLKEAKAKAASDAAANQAMWSAGGQIVGTAIGAYVGGPAGAAAGGTIGKAAGSMIGGMM